MRKNQPSLNEPTLETDTAHINTICIIINFILVVYPATFFPVDG